jgi:hypothetical protein
VTPIEQAIRDHDTVIERFVALCSADERIIAAFLGGSHARAEAAVATAAARGRVLRRAGAS